MAGKKRSGTRLASVPEVLNILEDRKKDSELGYEQTLAYEYATKFSQIKESDAKKMVTELEELGLEEKLALKMIEIMPDNASLAKLVLAMDKNRQPADDEAIGKILEVVKRYSK